MKEFRIKENKQGFVELQKSKFYSYAIYCENVDSFKQALAKIKKENPKAKHIVYAYKIETSSKSCDDNEPKGTAGRPILELIYKKNLNYIGIVVVRYFGGVKLGASRLLRTYLNSAIAAINECETLEVE